jgi:hypothetical protein
MNGGEHAVNDAERAHADRLAELLLEQLELLGLSEYDEAQVLTTVSRRLLRRMVELGEVIESEARDLDDRGALQMATAMQVLGPAADRVLQQLEEHARFGLSPTREPTLLPSPPPSWEGGNPPEPRPLWPRREARSRQHG